MQRDRYAISGRCALWALAALASFVGCELLASVPGRPEWARVGLALIGYISLVLLFGCALRAWRHDWSELWLLRKQARPRRSARPRAPERAALIYRARGRSEPVSRH